MRKLLLILMIMVIHGVARADTVLILGDSISAGYGLEKLEYGWVELLRARLAGRGWTVANASISGETSAGGLLRLDGLLQHYKPAVVVLELGANDGLRGQPPRQLEANLGEMILRSRAVGAKPILLGMKIPPNYGKRYADQFEQVFAKVAHDHEVPFVPFLLDGVGGQNHLMQADGLHPNRNAQGILLGLVWEKLGPVLGGGKPRN